MNLDSQPTPITSSDDEIDYSVKPEFYDPDLDSKDEIWVRKAGGGGGGGGTSDAVLSCPACFTTLCFESQRHETIVTQYRAVFVANCQLKPQVSLRTQQPPHQRGKRKHGTEALVVTKEEEEELFKPVCCAVCDTKVGFMDKDEVYHFVDVIPSEA